MLKIIIERPQIIIGVSGVNASPIAPFLSTIDREDGTITLNKRLYEVPYQYIDLKVEVRMDGAL